MLIYLNNLDGRYQAADFGWGGRDLKYISLARRDKLINLFCLGIFPERIGFWQILTKSN